MSEPNLDNDSVNSEINEHDKPITSNKFQILVNNMKDEDNMSRISSVINNRISTPDKPRDTMSIYSTAQPSTESHSKKLFQQNTDELNEAKRISMLINLKDKEINELKKNYEMFKKKYNENKKKLLENHQNYQSAKNVNVEIKKMICHLIMTKSKN